MTEERTCRCKGQFAMHKPHPHADRDGSEGRAQLEREHERALAAYVAEPERPLWVRPVWPAVEVEPERVDADRLSELARAVAAVTPCACSAQRARAEKAEAALARVEAALDIRSRARAWMHHLGYEDHEIDKAEAWRQPVEPWLQGDPPAAVIDLETAAGFAREYEEVIRAALRDPYAEAAS